MPMIYKRFTEKAAEEWRQIYKVSKGHPSLDFAYCCRLYNFSNS